MNRDVGSALLVLVGAAILRIATGDTYLRYVKASMRPWLVLAGLVLIVLGVLALLDVWRSVRASKSRRSRRRNPSSPVLSRASRSDTATVPLPRLQQA